jgi:hypothetical protein
VDEAEDQEGLKVLALVLELIHKRDSLTVFYVIPHRNAAFGVTLPRNN